MSRILFFCFVLLLFSGLPVIAGEKKFDSPVKYRVVINHEEQYSIWVADQELPRGWKATGFVGGKNEALDYITTEPQCPTPRIKFSRSFVPNGSLIHRE